MQFRYDINGLRAYAILSVLLFHFGITGFSGGFIGVDVFFVISGFLMTSIIFKAYEQNEFSLKKFFLDRAFRIVPALSVMCFVLIALGFLYLPPTEYQSLGKQVAASIAFVSNILFWQEFGYFSPSAHENWFLHTWSLSVEWQFYILYPLMLSALFIVLKPTMIRNLIILGVVSSFALSVFAAWFYPTAAFYLLPTRAWQLLAGGLIYFVPVMALSRFQRHGLHAAGIALIVVCACLYSEAIAWPGVYAALPVFAALMVILADCQNSYLTRNPPIQFLGTISYSCYLWHWPVVVGLYFMDKQHDMLWLGGGVILTFILSCASYYLVEIPFKRAHRQGHAFKQSFIFLLIFCAFISIAGYGVYLAEGLPKRFSDQVVLSDVERNNRNPKSKDCIIQTGVISPGCIYGGDGQSVSAIVIGDSHADAVISAVQDAIPETETGGVLFLGYTSCPTIRNVKNKEFINNQKFQCGAFIDQQIERLNNEFKDVPIFVINRLSVYVWNQHNPDHAKSIGPIAYFDTPQIEAGAAYLKLFQDRYVDSICALSKNRPVYIVQPIPEMPKNPPQYIARQLIMHGTAEDVVLPRAQYHQRQEYAINVMKKAAKECGARLLDPAAFLCDAQHCMGSDHMMPLYYDDDHLSEQGNKLLVKMFQSAFN